MNIYIAVTCKPGHKRTEPDYMGMLPFSTLEKARAFVNRRAEQDGAIPTWDSYLPLGGAAYEATWHTVTLGHHIRQTMVVFEYEIDKYAGQ